ncbi:MAG: hypothetical protein IPL04_12650 [Chitinophagaceae bacterium]|nr:hypothetical protein [Chitinophagaceae bacterium]
MLDQLKIQVIEYWGEDNHQSSKRPPLFAAYAKYLDGLKYQKTDYLKAQLFIRKQ